MWWEQDSGKRGTAECVASTDQTHMEHKEISSSNTTLPIRLTKKSRFTEIRVKKGLIVFGVKLEFSYVSILTSEV